MQGRLFNGRAPPGEGVLPVLIYVDKTMQEIGKRPYYPINLGFPTLPRDKVFKQGYCIQLGLIPMLEKDRRIKLKSGQAQYVPTCPDRMSAS